MTGVEMHNPRSALAPPCSCSQTEPDLPLRAGRTAALALARTVTGFQAKEASVCL